jgi:hypothetical protein
MDQQERCQCGDPFPSYKATSGLELNLHSVRPWTLNPLSYSGTSTAFVGKSKFSLENLPGQKPVKFEFAINLKTAKALGFTVPLTLQANANSGLSSFNANPHHVLSSWFRDSAPVRTRRNVGRDETTVLRLQPATPVR